MKKGEKVKIPILNRCGKYIKKVSRGHLIDVDNMFTFLIRGKVKRGHK